METAWIVTVSQSIDLLRGPRHVDHGSDVAGHAARMNWAQLLERVFDIDASVASVAVN